MRLFGVGNREGNAGEHADEFPHCGGEGGFVEIVEVEIDKTVVALVDSEILHVGVATNPDLWGGRELARFFREVFVEEMSSAAEERKGGLGEDLVFERKPLWIATVMESEDALEYRHLR